MKKEKASTFLVLDGTATTCRVRVAKRVLERMRGLLAHPPLLAEQGLWIEPCNSIHTWFMSYPIDVVFLDRQGSALQVCEHVRPWGMRTCWRAKAVLELCAGQAELLGIAVGSRLQLAA